MAWVYLIMAGLCEVVWAIGIKYCNEFKINLPLLIVIISLALSMIFFALAIKDIPMGVAYAVWTGIGIVGVFLFEILALKEPISIFNILFVSLILIGIIGLKLANK